MAEQKRKRSSQYKTSEENDVNNFSLLYTLRIQRGTFSRTEIAIKPHKGEEATQEGKIDFSRKLHHLLRSLFLQSQQRLGFWVGRYLIKRTSWL